MKKLICLLFTISILTGCSPNANLENGDNEIKQTEKEISSIVSETEKEEISLVSVAESIEFWNKYAKDYTVRAYEWANDDYFFVLLENKENDNLRYLFWDTQNEKLIDLEEHDIELFLEKQVFTRDGNLYVISTLNKITKIELGSFDISYIDTDIPEEYAEKELKSILSLSPTGTVAELKDEYTLLLYDIFAPEQKKTVDLRENTPFGIMINRGVEWSFDGKYLALIFYEGEPNFYQDAHGSLYTSDGKFIRNISGYESDSWDTDNIWGGGGGENYYIYSLTDKNSKPLTVFKYFVPLYQFHRRNGIYFYQETNNNQTECEIIMVDSFKNIVEPVVKFDIDAFSNIIYPSPNGKCLAFIEINKDYFFFDFMESCFKEPDK